MLNARNGIVWVGSLLVAVQALGACGETNEVPGGVIGGTDSGGGPVGGRSPTGGTTPTGGRSPTGGIGGAGSGGEGLGGGGAGGAGAGGVAGGGAAGEAGGAGDSSVGGSSCTLRAAAEQVEVGETTELSIRLDELGAPGSEDAAIATTLFDGDSGWSVLCRSPGTTRITAWEGMLCSVEIECVTDDPECCPPTPSQCVIEPAEFFGSCSAEGLRGWFEEAGPGLGLGGAGGSGGSDGAGGNNDSPPGGAAGAGAPGCNAAGRWRIVFPESQCQPEPSCGFYYPLPPSYGLELDAPDQLEIRDDGCTLSYVQTRPWMNISECGVVGYRLDLRIDGDVATGTLLGVESGFCNGQIRTTALATRVR